MLKNLEWEISIVDATLHLPLFFYIFVYTPHLERVYFFKSSYLSEDMIGILDSCMLNCQYDQS